MDKSNKALLWVIFLLAITWWGTRPQPPMSRQAAKEQLEELHKERMRRHEEEVIRELYNPENWPLD